MIALAAHEARPHTIGEHGLRRQIDASISRALFDREFARQLLSDPTVVLGDLGCTPQQYLELRSIRAETLSDLARQAEALFWLTTRSASSPEEQRPLSAAAI
jgi:hypothetical protein